MTERLFQDLLQNVVKPAEYAAEEVAEGRYRDAELPYERILGDLERAFGDSQHKK